MIVSDNTIQVEGLVDFCKNLGRNSARGSKILAEILPKKQARALEIGANIGCGFASRSPKQALSSILEVKNFDHTGTGLYLPRLV